MLLSPHFMIKFKNLTALKIHISLHFMKVFQDEVAWDFSYFPSLWELDVFWSSKQKYEDADMEEVEITKLPSSLESLIL